VGRSLFDELDREWASLAVSAVAQRAFDKWKLAGISGLSELVSVVHNRDDYERSDNLLRKVVGRAKRDDVACRAVLQCMMPAMRSLAWRYRGYDTRVDVESQVVTETLARIRHYPLGRRPDHIAANIVRDVGQVFWRSVGRTVELELSHSVLSVPILQRGRSATSEVSDLLLEGVRTGGVTTDEAALVFATRVLDESVNALAERAGVQPQSIRKRRQRAEAKLEAMAVEI
jgi:hypothetical protein